MAQAQQSAAAARGDVDDPVFRLATVLPWVGDNLSAVSSIAVSVDDVAQQVLPPLLQLADVADPTTLKVQSSSIDLAPFVSAAPALQSADDAVAVCEDRIRSIDPSGLTDSVRSAVDDLATKLATLRSVTTASARLTHLLPPMLGSEGPRRYLVVFQNIAELRSTGGIFGSYAVLTATDGHLAVSGQGATSRTMGRFDTPVADLTPDELKLYDVNIGTIPMDVNFTPDFALAAQLFSKMYQDRIDPAPLDGVIAVDPVALAEVLKGFAPVTVEGQRLSSDTVVKLLLSDAYTLFPNDWDQSQRDAFLSEANAAAFDMITSAPSDMGAVVNGLRQAASGRRILLYSSHPDEQAALRAYGYTGELPANDPADAPTFGVFLNDRTYMGSKLAYYLSGAVQLTADGCRDDGSREVTAQVQLNFNAPSSGLPLHVSGSGPNPYVLVTEFRVFAPTDGSVTAAEFDGRPVTMVNGTDLNRSVGLFRVNLQPGSSTTVTLHFLLPRTDGGGSMEQPSVYLAPAVKAWPITAPAFPTCG